MTSVSRRCRGYSLIELLVVLAIAAVLATVAMTYRLDRVGPAVKGAMQEINTVLLDARSLARTSGRPVPLVPAGDAFTATLNYTSTATAAELPTTVMPSGTFNLAGDSATARFCMVPFNRDAATVDNALNSLNGALAGATVTTQAVFSANVWLTNAFNCDPDLTFNTNGTANREVYIAIVGQRNGSMIVNGPVGIILVTTSGNIYRYFRADNTSNWTKL